MLCSHRILKVEDDTYYECQCHFNLYNDTFHKHQGWGFQNMILFSSIKVENCYKMALIMSVDVDPTHTMTLYRVSILRWMKL